MLPPPDPFESPVVSPGGRLSAPAAVFVKGRPSREVDRLADAILAMRPGALVVVVRD
ncbi:MAG TPA: hypothetical protein VH418_07590 [Solirubrobacteraceae bacterium]|jgi:hypothetical protein